MYANSQSMHCACTYDLTWNSEILTHLQCGSQSEARNISIKNDNGG